MKKSVADRFRERHRLPREAGKVRAGRRTPRRQDDCEDALDHVDEHDVDVYEDLRPVDDSEDEWD